MIKGPFASNPNPKAAKKQIVQYVFLSLFIVFQNEIIMMVTHKIIRLYL
jgi:hypothetical protein